MPLVKGGCVLLSVVFCIDVDVVFDVDVGELFFSDGGVLDDDNLWFSWDAIDDVVDDDDVVDKDEGAFFLEFILLLLLVLLSFCCGCFFFFVLFSFGFSLLVLRLGALLAARAKKALFVSIISYNEKKNSRGYWN